MTMIQRYTISDTVTTSSLYTHTHIQERKLPLMWKCRKRSVTAAVCVFQV